MENERDSNMQDDLNDAKATIDKKFNDSQYEIIENDEHNITEESFEQSHEEDEELPETTNQNGVEHFNDDENIIENTEITQNQEIYEDENENENLANNERFKGFDLNDKDTEEINREEEEINLDEDYAHQKVEMDIDMGNQEDNIYKANTNITEELTNREDEEVNGEGEETIREGEETNREGVDTTKEGEETNREDDETIRDGEETVKEGEETNREDDDTIREGEETNREVDETVGEGEETKGDGDETIREEEETNIELDETIGEGEETNKEGDEPKGESKMKEEEYDIEGSESNIENETNINGEEENHGEEEGLDEIGEPDREEGMGDSNDPENDVEADNVEVVEKGTQEEIINNEARLDEGEKSNRGINKANQIEIDTKPSNKIDGVSNFFTAPVQLDDGSVKHHLVTIVRSKCKKIFLGGYRHKVSGVIYHHASVQTMPKRRPPPKVELFSRDTQTFQMKHQKVNTDNITSTQMTQPGLYVSNVTDKLMAPKHYETADEYKERILQNIIVIQKYYRRWLAKQVVDEKRKQRDDRLYWDEAEKDRKKKEKEERIQKEYKRRMHPKTKADFDLLYNDLEKWREEQMAVIDNSNITEAEKKARKALLLEEETDLLAAIDRHKLDRKEETKTEAVQKLLSKAAAPKSWKDAKGRKIEMNTQFTIRSRELLEIFNSLNMQYLTSDERLDVLLTLKHTVKEHDCKLTKDIVELVDREADLIMRNVKETSLVGLRKRISTLFLQYCKTPTFNPQISSLLKVPSDTSVLVGDINYCKYCGRYLRSTEFSLSTKSSKLTICKSCARKDNQSRNRQDYSHYRRILKEIQMNEQEIGDGSKIAFIFKQNDVKSLIESVWDGKSVLSGCDDLDELMFMRWDSRDHWTPWNTIFLTKDEAEAHVKVSSLVDTYSNVLINRITQKHVIAKNLFGSLEKMIGDFQAKTTNVPIKV